MCLLIPDSTLPHVFGDNIYMCTVLCLPGCVCCLRMFELVYNIIPACVHVYAGKVAQ